MVERFFLLQAILLKVTEVNAIKQASKTEGADNYVTRHTPTGMAMAKPCDNCMEAIRAAGIRRIYYTNDGLQGDTMKELDPTTLKIIVAIKNV